jgi:ATP-dependent RNA helicase DDX24/MAK5
MQQSNRLKNFDKFKSSQKSILFCTDIGARGLDIPNIDLVIHYHIPTKTETFVHRSGRTARANKNGNVVSLISEKEIDLYRKIMKDLNLKEFVLKSISLDKIEKIKSLFEFAKEVELHDFKKRKENNE